MALNKSAPDQSFVSSDVPLSERTECALRRAAAQICCGHVLINPITIEPHLMIVSVGSI